MIKHHALLATVLGLALVPCATAQEHKELGRMWTFENAPLDYFDSEYGFRPTQEWLDHARLAALRFGKGCSASFVSPRGLIMTNHHCARESIAKVSPEGQDWLTNGFYAGSLKDEVKIPGLTVQQLVWMKNVTTDVDGGKTEGDIIAEAKEKDSGLTYQLVSLYQGGMYQLYAYKIYDDIRLVAAPHLLSAKFGGDPDNFTYPRYDLDFSFCRAWENGKPADTKKFYFRWRTAGPTENETVFVVGNPGSTGRLNTIAQMEFMRDAYYPWALGRVHQILDRLHERASDDPERGKALRTTILNYENTRKAFQGYLDGLRNDQVMEIKRKAEKEIRDRVDADPKLKEKYASAWTELEQISKQKAEQLEAGKRPAAELAEREKAAAKRVGEAFFAVYGTEIPPDATFTLRISDGRVKGYPYNGTIAPFFTCLYGLYARYTEFFGKDPFELPKVWLDKRDKLDLSTPFNLVTTCDIIGGNSGSPMIDTDLRVVGLVFDGNIQMLGNRFVFTDDVARTVCVHPAIIIEALRKIYGAGKLADELEKGHGYN